MLKQVQHDMSGTYHDAAEGSYDDRQWTEYITMTTAQIKTLRGGCRIKSGMTGTSIPLC
jgi:hypothetical protein